MNVIKRFIYKCASWLINWW